MKHLPLRWFERPLAAVRLAIAFSALASQTLAQDAIDWSVILAATPAELPEPQDEVEWRSDFPAALREADKTGRPLFVTLRCLPCKQCASFDQDVLEGGDELTPLLRQFITVRITDAMQIDLARLPVAGFQDLDMSWWGWCLSPDARVYSVFGGRDEESDSTRISSAALVNTLRRVLDHHYAPRRMEWNIDGEATPAVTAPRPPSELTGYESWRRQSIEAPKQSCLHCHQVAEIMRQPAIDAGSFDKKKLTPWPLPENVGLHLDRDDGLLVTKVRSDSPASEAGIEIGDRLAVAAGRRLFGQADLRGVLHRHDGIDPRIEIGWLRGDTYKSATLEPKGNWRTTVLDWRMSISQGNIGAAPGFFPLAAGKSPNAMAIKPFFGRDAHASATYAAGLRGHHVIVAVDGVRDPMTSRSFLTWFRMRYEPGDDVVFTVRDGGKERDLSVELKWK